MPEVFGSWRLDFEGFVLLDELFGLDVDADCVFAELYGQLNRDLDDPRHRKGTVGLQVVLSLLGLDPHFLCLPAMGLADLVLAVAARIVSLHLADHRLLEDLQVHWHFVYDRFRDDFESVLVYLYLIDEVLVILGAFNT